MNIYYKDIHSDLQNGCTRSQYLVALCFCLENHSHFEVNISIGYRSTPSPSVCCIEMQNIRINLAHLKVGSENKLLESDLSLYAPLFYLKNINWPFYALLDENLSMSCCLS